MTFIGERNHGVYSYDPDNWRLKTFNKAPRMPVEIFDKDFDELPKAVADALRSQNVDATTRLTHCTVKASWNDSWDEYFLSSDVLAKRLIVDRGVYKIVGLVWNEKGISTDGGQFSFQIISQEGILHEPADSKNIRNRSWNHLFLDCLH